MANASDSVLGGTISLLGITYKNMDQMSTYWSNLLSLISDFRRMVKGG